MGRQAALKIRAFTVLELMVAVVILTVIVSLSSVGYSKYRDKAAMLVDETNLKVLSAAAKLYAYDTNSLPSSFSQLRDGDLRRAYALVTEGKRPYTLFAFLQEQAGLLDIAEATRIPDRYLGDSPARVLKCPMDDAPPSYGLHALAAGQPLSWLLDQGNANLSAWQHFIVESDSINPTDADFVYRHEGRRTYVYASASGAIRRYSTGGTGGSGGSGPFN